MKKQAKKWLRPVLFTVVGALVGLAYYYFALRFLNGCSDGTCFIMLNPVVAMICTGLIGALLSGGFGKEE